MKKFIRKMVQLVRKQVASPTPTMQRDFAESARKLKLKRAQKEALRIQKRMEAQGLRQPIRHLRDRVRGPDNA
jgi:hypothetical protein